MWLRWAANGLERVIPLLLQGDDLNAEHAIDNVHGCDERCQEADESQDRAQVGGFHVNGRIFGDATRNLVGADNETDPE